METAPAPQDVQLSEAQKQEAEQRAHRAIAATTKQLRAYDRAAMVDMTRGRQHWKGIGEAAVLIVQRVEDEIGSMPLELRMPLLMFIVHEILQLGAELKVFRPGHGLAKRAAKAALRKAGQAYGIDFGVVLPMIERLRRSDVATGVLEGVA